MFIKNISVKILGIAGVTILPDETAEIPDSFVDDPTLQAWERMDFVVETIPKKAEMPKTEANSQNESVSKPTEDEIKAATKKAELLALAGKYGIEVSTSMTISQLRAALT